MSDNHAAALDTALAVCPAVAILRGIQPAQAVEIAQALVDCGFRIIEVPLNSPDPYESIRRLRAHFGSDIVVGAGTVLTASEVESVAAAGGQVCVAPNCDARVIRESLRLGLVPVPGVATATEAFQAIEAGARFLKCFPAGALGAQTVRALVPVLPSHARLLAVGGVTAENVAAFLAAGCAGIGTGSDVFKPGWAPEEVKARGTRILKALQAPNPGGESDQRKLAQAARVRRVAATTALVGESPFWHAQTGEIVWVDFGRRAALRCNPTTGSIVSTELDTTLSVILATAEGRVLGVAADTIRDVDLATGVTAPVATVELPYRDTRLNDAAIDPRGRIWSGSMSYALLSGQGALFITEPGGSTRRLAEGFGVCNGIGFSPDYGTLFMVDTLHRTLLAFDCDMDEGTIRRPRIVTDFLHVPGKPDGLTVGTDGGIWVAMWGGARVVRVELDGRISRDIEIPAKHASNCCFAGTDPDTLYVTTSRYRLSEAELAAAPWSGSLLAIDL